MAGGIWDLSLHSLINAYRMGYKCSRCGRPYKTKYTLRRHERLECGIPAQYQCKLCDYRAKHKHSLKHHFEGVHKKKFKLKYAEDVASNWDKGNDAQNTPVKFHSFYF